MKKRVKPNFNEMGMTQWYWRVLHPDNLDLGENTEIGSFTIIDAMKGVSIENNVKIGFGCTIISYSSIDKKEGTIILKQNCKIGSNTVIMPGVTIGKNAVVGANSFVNKNIPSNEVWVGNPAKYLKNCD
ncbi:acyltransferase [Methanobacterium sp.]|uniref:acyltransferase n=1 Tax=Methanobacterium sp. TaxID=2164 RepID=UPI002ABBD6D1|nr:acyltransferase [Methanobacterium sp.]MDY9922955.1 acyltransferase [Methanobacterium sp.]